MMKNMTGVQLRQELLDRLHIEAVLHSDAKRAEIAERAELGDIVAHDWLRANKWPAAARVLREVGAL